MIFRFLFSMFSSRTNLVEKSGILHIYYSNKPFKHWKKRWLHLQDQQLSIYQGNIYLKTIRFRLYSVILKTQIIDDMKKRLIYEIIEYQLQMPMIQYLIKDTLSK